MRIKIKLLDKQYLPVYTTYGSSGADLHAHGDWNIKPHTRMLIPLGVCFEIPIGYEIQIRPRSGMTKKEVDIGFGTIDSDYRGEVCAVVINNSNSIFAVRDGDRICQMVYSPVIHVGFIVVDDINSTERGINGFGSTGI